MFFRYERTKALDKDPLMDRINLVNPELALSGKIPCNILSGKDDTVTIIGIDTRCDCHHKAIGMGSVIFIMGEDQDRPPLCSA